MKSGQKSIQFNPRHQSKLTRTNPNQAFNPNLKTQYPTKIKVLLWSMTSLDVKANKRKPNEGIISLDKLFNLFFEFIYIVFEKISASFILGDDDNYTYFE